MRKNLSPRYSAGSVELKEGTGPITMVCSYGEFLELYKADKTFRLKTPETIDPEETNPDAPWVVSPVSNVGSSNPIIARVLLQGHEILRAALFEGNINKELITKQLHKCKEALLACESLAKRVGEHIDDINQEINENDIGRDNHGRALNPFPQVPDLDTCQSASNTFH